MIRIVTLDRRAAEKALRTIIAGLDYDLHKQIKQPEDGGPSEYPGLASMFARAYEVALATGEREGGAW